MEAKSSGSGTGKLRARGTYEPACDICARRWAPTLLSIPSKIPDYFTGKPSAGGSRPCVNPVDNRGAIKRFVVCCFSPTIMLTATCSVHGWRISILYHAPTFHIMMGTGNPRVSQAWPRPLPVNTLTLSQGWGIPRVRVRVWWGFKGIRVASWVTVYLRKIWFYTKY